MTTRKRGDKMVARSRQVSPSGKASMAPSPVYGSSSQIAKVGSKVYPAGTAKAKR